MKTSLTSDLIGFRFFENHEKLGMVKARVDQTLMFALSYGIRESRG